MRKNKVFKVKILKMFKLRWPYFFSPISTIRLLFNLFSDFTNIIFFVLIFCSSMDYIKD